MMAKKQYYWVDDDNKIKYKYTYYNQKRNRQADNTQPHILLTR